MKKINLNKVMLAVTAGQTSQFLSSNLPEVAFSGRSNVGKSSLINTLIGRKSLARVSSSPGKTITVNYYDVDGVFYLVDLPGYGFAKRSPDERKRISRLGDTYFKSPNLRLTVQLIDMRSGPTNDDYTMIDYMEQLEIPFVIAATKSDKLNKTEREKMLAALVELGHPVIPFSSLKGEGRDELWNVIVSAVDEK